MGTDFTLKKFLSYGATAHDHIYRVDKKSEVIFFAVLIVLLKMSGDFMSNKLLNILLSSLGTISVFVILFYYIYLNTVVTEGV